MTQFKTKVPEWRCFVVWYYPDWFPQSSGASQLSHLGLLWSTKSTIPKKTFLMWLSTGRWWKFLFYTEELQLHTHPTKPNKVMSYNMLSPPTHPFEAYLLYDRNHDSFTEKKLLNQTPFTVERVCTLLFKKKCTWITWITILKLRFIFIHKWSSIT